MRWVFMLTKSPFLTRFPPLLFGSAKRRMQEVMRAERKGMRERSPGALSRQLAEEIPPEMVGGTPRPNARVYSQEVTFWALLAQTLSGDGSCAHAVAQVQ